MAAPALQEEPKISEAEAALYDRQIRLWGLEAQQRMRSSTVLVLNLNSLANETIKNIVLSGIGHLIAMDASSVDERDLAAGFLFRENDGVVGQKKVDAALPQIQSLNPLVKVTPSTSTAPFLPASSEDEMVNYLKENQVSVLVLTDSDRASMIAIDRACQRANTLFIASGTYAMTGYIVTSLGPSFSYITEDKTEPLPGQPAAKGRLKNTVSMLGVAGALEADKGLKGLTKQNLKRSGAGGFASLLALWDWEARNGRLPTEVDVEAPTELRQAAEELLTAWGVSLAAIPDVADITQHLARVASLQFSPTSAVLGGLLAQDVLRLISRSGLPTVGFLWYDSGVGWETAGERQPGEKLRDFGGAAIGRWGVHSTVEPIKEL